MKKILLSAVFLMVSALFGELTAQTLEEMNASKERYAKLEKLFEKAPKQCNHKSVDALAGSTTIVLAESIEITPLLEGLYYRSIGQTEDGVTDVTVKKPTLEECTELSMRIAAQAVAVKAATELIEPTAADLKTLKNPRVAAKAVKSLDYSKDALIILGEETAYQTKAIASIIETIKSADNL